MTHHETWPHLDHSNAVRAAGEREELTRDHGFRARGSVWSSSGCEAGNMNLQHSESIAVSQLAPPWRGSSV